MFAATSAARGVTLPVRPLAKKVRAMPRSLSRPASAPTIRAREARATICARAEDDVSRDASFE
jgi:hypothetical protein